MYHLKENDPKTWESSKYGCTLSVRQAKHTEWNSEEQSVQQPIQIIFACQNLLCDVNTLKMKYLTKNSEEYS